MKKLPPKLLWLLVLTGSVAIAAPNTFVDPTRPAFYVPSSASNTPNSKNLTMIFFSPQQQRVILDGNLLSVGDHYGQFTITVITPYSVELSGPQNTKEVLFLTTDVKTAVTEVSR